MLFYFFINRIAFMLHPSINHNIRNVCGHCMLTQIISKHRVHRLQVCMVQALKTSSMYCSRMDSLNFFRSSFLMFKWWDPFMDPVPFSTNVYVEHLRLTRGLVHDSASASTYQMCCTEPTATYKTPYQLSSTTSLIPNLLLHRIITSK